MSIDVIPNQAVVYQQWVQGISDSFEAFRGLADAQLRIAELALGVGVASLESFKSVLRMTIDEDISGKLLSQPLRQAMTAAVQSALNESASGTANDSAAAVPATT